MSKLWIAAFLLGLMLFCLSGPFAIADDVEMAGAKQVVSLFTRCMEYAGDPTGLRTWLRATLKPAPDDLANKYLEGRPGQVFGGDSPSGGIAVGSEDGGGCTVFADHANGDAVYEAFEAWLAQAKLTFPPPRTDMPASGAPLGMRSRPYEISGFGKRWRVVISTTLPGKARFEAIMSAYSLTSR